jgi:hypothetical protein
MYGRKKADGKSIDMSVTVRVRKKEKKLEKENSYINEIPTIHKYKHTITKVDCDE